MRKTSRRESTREENPGERQEPGHSPTPTPRWQVGAGKPRQRLWAAGRDPGKAGTSMSLSQARSSTPVTAITASLLNISSEAGERRSSQPAELGLGAQSPQGPGEAGVSLSIPPQVGGRAAHTGPWRASGVEQCRDSSPGVSPVFLPDKAAHTTYENN